MREASYYVEQKLKPPKAFFDWCYSQIHTFKWSNKSETILASDRKNCYVVEKRLTKKSRLTFFDKFYTFAIVLVTPKRIEIQSYGFWSSVENGKQDIECSLTNFEQFANNEHVEVTEQYNRYCFGLTPNFGGGMSGPYTGTRFYPNDWTERIQTISELRYLEFDYLDHYHLEGIYKYRNEIEFLQKINAKVLAKEVMYPKYNYSGGTVRKCVDMRVINQKWLRQNKQFFKNSNRSFNEYELERRIKARGGKVVPGIEEYLNYRDINKIPNGVGLIRFQNWMIKNKVDFTYYKDYLGMLRDLDVVIDNENLIIPKDLVKAHDSAVELMNQMQLEKKRLKNEKLQIEYEKRLEKRRKLEAEIGDYLFVIPNEVTDLVKEGKALHHCVGSSSYVKNHSKGRTTIIFVRKKEAADKPFFTMEYQNGRVVQLRGKHNISAPEEVQQAVDKWLDWVSSSKKQLAKAS